MHDEQGDGEQLFDFLDDLEQRAEGLFAQERAPELADRSRSEYQQVTLASRLMSSLGSQITAEVEGIGALTGILESVGDRWCRVSGVSGQWLVALAHVTTVAGASQRAVPEVAWSPLSRLGLPSALRALGASGERCVLRGSDGSSRAGLVRRVGQDFLELEQAPGRVLLVAFEGLCAVQTQNG